MSFDFLNHCKICPSSTTHCCTKKGNIVLINEDEKVQIQAHFDNLKNELQIENLDTYTLFNDAKTQNGVTPLNLISTKDPDSLEDIDRCPFFVKPFCKLHTLGKPLDCKLWPVSKFENGDKGLVYIDYNCSALKSKDKIPVSTVEESITLFSTLTDEKKSVYYNQSNSHYRLVPIPKNQWEAFQKFFSYKEKITNQCDTKLKQFVNNYIDIFYNTKATIKVSKWIIGIIFVMILGSMFNLVTNNVSNYSHSDNTFLSHLNDFWRIIAIIILPIIFILDVYRIIVPLPWITKYIDENSQKIPELEKEKNNLPKFQLLKLLTIGSLSFVLLNLLSIRFIYHPVWYFTFFSAVLILDMFWYKYNRQVHSSFFIIKNIEDEINEIKKHIEKKLKSIEKKLDKLMPRQIGNYNDISFTVLLEQVNELKTKNKNYTDKLNDQAITAKVKEEIIQKLEQDVKKEYGFSSLVSINILISLMYPILYFVQNYPTIDFRPFDYFSENLFILIIYFLHSGCIIYELKNYNFYLEELNYFYLKEEKN
jgi:hypothetical protein